MGSPDRHRPRKQKGSWEQSFENHWTRVINAGYLRVLVTGDLFSQTLMSHHRGFNWTLSIILIISDINIFPKCRINMIINIYSQKLPTHPILRKPVNSFKKRSKVSGWEHRKLARPMPQQYKGRRWCYFLKTVFMKPLMWEEWGRWRVFGRPSLFTGVS